MGRFSSRCSLLIKLTGQSCFLQADYKKGSTVEGTIAGGEGRGATIFIARIKHTDGVCMFQVRTLAFIFDLPVHTCFFIRSRKIRD